LESLGVKVEGADASVLVGLECHVRREKYPQPEGKGKAFDNDSETLLPTLIKAGSTSAPAAAAAPAADEMDELLMAAVDGKGDADIPELLKGERLKALGLSPAKTFKKIDGLVKAGRLSLDKKTGLYSAV
jgi:hypothetical protein